MNARLTSPEMASPASTDPSAPARAGVLRVAPDPAPVLAPISLAVAEPPAPLDTPPSRRRFLLAVGAACATFALGVLMTGSVLATGVKLQGALPIIALASVTVVMGCVAVIGQWRQRHALESARLAAVMGLSRALDVREAGTSDHSTTVATYTEAIARELGLGPRRVKRIRIAGLVHDIGEVGVPDAVLLAPGRLSEREWRMMRRHPELGARMLGGMGLDDIQGWVLAHHERPDGSGYPLGLSAAQIPLEASILAVADAYEGMTSDRVYRDGLDTAAGQAELVQGRGTQFDAAVVDAFIRYLGTVAVPSGRTTPLEDDAT